jgi:hypothetical protein
MNHVINKYYLVGKKVIGTITSNDKIFVSLDDLFYFGDYSNACPFYSIEGAKEFINSREDKNQLTVYADIQMVSEV